MFRPSGIWIQYVLTLFQLEIATNRVNGDAMMSNSARTEEQQVIVGPEGHHKTRRLI
jgi:hypothetical protein